MTLDVSRGHQVACWFLFETFGQHYKSLLVSRQDLFAKQDLLLYGFFAQSNWCWLSCSRTIDHVDIAFRPFQN
jgi:hypothetical protein